ncbi:MAG: VWA domain-containing protein [Victivallales bacterium]|nr:VWA domain-containing protein [Victivallales bacterium]
MKFLLPLILALLASTPQIPGKTARVVVSDNRIVVCRAELEKPVLPAGESIRTVVKITLDAARVPTDKKRPPINLAVVLDRSGSMSGSKIEHAKKAAIAALRRLDEGDIFSLIAYNNGVETVIPAQAADDADGMERRIRKISSGGGTNLFGGVNQGASELRKHLSDRRYTPRIILLSDGLANVGPSSPDELGRLGAALVKEGISVTTVGVGNDYNEDLMTQLSQKSDGNTYFVENSNDLPRIFAAELGDVLNVVARKVTIEIDCPAGIRPIRIIGRDGRLRGQRAEIFMNQLYGGQSKYVLLEVEVPATAAEQTRQLASARCVYRNALSDLAAESRSSVSARFSGSKRAVIDNVNLDVQTELGANYNAMLVNEVVDLADKGKTKEAVVQLRKRSAQLSQQALLYNNGLLEAQSIDLKKRAAKLEKEGMGRSMRKLFRADSYQTTNQQEIR